MTGESKSAVVGGGNILYYLSLIKAKSAVMYEIHYSVHVQYMYVMYIHT